MKAALRPEARTVRERPLPRGAARERTRSAGPVPRQVTEHPAAGGGSVALCTRKRLE